MFRDEASRHMEELFRNKVKKDNKIYNAYMLIHSEKYNIHLNMAEGVTEQIQSNPMQQFHIASIGKLFVSVLTGILFEQEKISYEDRIKDYFNNDLLNDLHVYKGKDYTGEIKIKHILNHTSGLPDYFEDKPKYGKSMLEMIFEEPYRRWKPEDIIIWSKANLKSHFPPGRGFHYSDTGYHILGLIIERILGCPLNKALEEYIFRPLHMDFTYLDTYEQSTKNTGFPVADVYFNDINVKGFNILKDDYAGGGVISTTEDMLKFMEAISKHVIIKKETFERMKDWAGFFNFFFLGIDYGYGLMQFKEIPILQPKKYNIWGNAGSIGSFMFYQPELDTYFIGSLNQFRYHSKGIRTIFKMIDILTKLEK
ncbi:serine hydrolase domain-containing protein [Serpentinicella alkaliphila]|uniref:CubicO group peptidase (Beta-lactamase class C family) n=1 Tax=Serpentinicella alkaliphila TaxID=1734049 RepID=A0A4R2THG2_9FIRM|nr:serine hydrolase domain-containing protein [Serpentinicella alkaliphila]QUH26235.1 beta-lactamase family protein [Serpentinicella alkaliphila]TCQ01697.1 CubicO group peptidase (beta-lactamase class C family) [Serpentinicella alkaliphila]